MNLRRVASIILVVGTAWVFFEWLFFVTKPSFMSLFSLSEKLGILSSTALIVSVALLLASLPFVLLAELINRLPGHRFRGHVVILLPAGLLAAMATLVVIDNFTLTLFGWGIRNASGAGLYVYRLVTVILGIFAGWVLYGLLGDRYSDATLKSLTIASIILLIGSIPMLALALAESGEDDADIESVASVGNRPNIIILSGDGISAEHMSLYGYHRPTTPFMDSVQSEFLVAENHFTNASDTGGSVISLLTGKLPLTTRVIYPPDVLRGGDSYQHLPGLLKRLGYYNADISMRHYADPYDLNLREGFSEANFRQLRETGGTLVSTIRQYPALNPTSMLIDRISERIAERFGHIWKDKKMLDPLAEVNRPDLRWIRDPDRMKELRRLITSAPRPFFINVHMMGTHGERFRPTQRFYSTDADYETLWSLDGYDDAILDFDRNVEETYKLLAEQDLLKSTVLLVSSDHGLKHNALDRLPMMLRLPGRQNAGRIGGNTQRLDIAPTLLDIMGLEPKSWMEGRSMLAQDSRPLDSQPIFASGSRSEKSNEGMFWSVSAPQPPWYSLGKLFLIHCDQGFIMGLDTMKITSRKIPGSTAQCQRQLSNEEALAVMLKHLKEKAYSWE